MQALPTIIKTVRREIIVKAAEEMIINLSVEIDLTMTKADIVARIRMRLFKVRSSSNFSESSINLFKKMGWEEGSKDLSFYGKSTAIVYPFRQEIDTYMDSLKHMSLWKEGSIFGITSEFESGMVAIRLFGNEEVAIHSFCLQSGKEVPHNIPAEEELNTQGVILTNEKPPIKITKTRKDAVIIALQSEPETLADWVSTGSEIYRDWGGSINTEKQRLFTQVMLHGIAAFHEHNELKITRIVNMIKEFDKKAKKNSKTRPNAIAKAITEGVFEETKLIQRSIDIHTKEWGKKNNSSKIKWYADVMLAGITCVSCE